MCTIGAVNRFVFKTLDFNAKEIRIEKTNQMLGISTPTQGGLNAGLNRWGLGLVMCYYGTDVNPDVETDWRVDDRRSLYNEDVLAKCRDVSEAVEHMSDLIRRNGSKIGGVHLFLDHAGCIGVVEHFGEKMNKRIIDRAFATFANDSSLDESGTVLPELIELDRRIRSDKMTSFLTTLSNGEVKNVSSEIKTILSSHEKVDGEIGSICIHHHNLFGARANTKGTMQTATAILLDVLNLSMEYSLGNPCLGQWQSTAM